jgi:hypothetical protein
MTIKYFNVLLLENLHYDTVHKDNLAVQYLGKFPPEICIAPDWRIVTNRSSFFALKFSVIYDKRTSVDVQLQYLKWRRHFWLYLCTDCRLTPSQIIYSYAAVNWGSCLLLHWTSGKSFISCFWIPYSHICHVCRRCALHVHKDFIFPQMYIYMYHAGVVFFVWEKLSSNQANRCNRDFHCYAYFWGLLQVLLNILGKLPT